jgi:phosphoenolpyruvate carboxykinase (GTP)
MTTAAFGEIGKVRRDPFAMLPFAGYHMADYFRHWLEFGRKLKHPPRIFSVNWFRKDENGKFIWPGFGENLRVLKWIVDRVNGKTAAVESPIGWMPRYEDMDFSGIDFSKDQFDKIMTIDPEEWKKELLDHQRMFEEMYNKTPKDMFYMRELLVSNLWRTGGKWRS